MSSQFEPIAEPSYWVLKTVPEEERSLQTVDSYRDNIKEYYNYDSLVANHKQIKSNDYAVLIDKKKILGFAHISTIDQRPSKKTIRRCPVCRSTSIDKRKTKLPLYRCDQGHEFDVPEEDIKDVTSYSAKFYEFIEAKNIKTTLKDLRPYYKNKYNPNMSMQLLSNDSLQLFGNFSELFSTYSPLVLLDRDANDSTDVDTYNPNTNDERQAIIRSIKLRRGQKKFRDGLLDKYKSTCVITGCKILAVLEAAHINPYRGEKDHNPQNGLLLRADIHTLFDLNLIGIHPETYKVHLSDKIKLYQEYSIFEGKDLNLILNENNTSNQALEIRWREFLQSK